MSEEEGRAEGLLGVTRSDLRAGDVEMAVLDDDVERKRN